MNPSEEKKSGPHSTTAEHAERVLEVGKLLAGAADEHSYTLPPAVKMGAQLWELGSVSARLDQSYRSCVAGGESKPFCAGRATLQTMAKFVAGEFSAAAAAATFPACETALTTTLFLPAAPTLAP